MNTIVAIAAETPAVIEAENPRLKIDWGDIRARIKAAVAQAYAEATPEQIRQHVEQPLIDARNGLVDIIPPDTN